MTGPRQSLGSGNADAQASKGAGAVYHCNGCNLGKGALLFRENLLHTQQQLITVIGERIDNDLGQQALAAAQGHTAGRRRCIEDQ